MNTHNTTMTLEDARLYAEAKRHILKTRNILKEFPNYPKSWLNKIICFRYKLTDPLAKQIRSYMEYERKHGLKNNLKTIVIEQSGKSE